MFHNSTGVQNPLLEILLSSSTYKGTQFSERDLDTSRVVINSLINTFNSSFLEQRPINECVEKFYSYQSGIKAAAIAYLIKELKIMNCLTETEEDFLKLTYTAYTKETLLPNKVIPVNVDTRHRFSVIDLIAKKAIAQRQVRFESIPVNEELSSDIPEDSEIMTEEPVVVKDAPPIRNVYLICKFLVSLVVGNIALIAVSVFANRYYFESK